MPFFLQGDACALERLPLPEKLPAAAALALSADGGRLLLALPEGQLLVMDTQTSEASAAFLCCASMWLRSPILCTVYKCSLQCLWTACRVHPGRSRGAVLMCRAGGGNFCRGGARDRLCGRLCREQSGSSAAAGSAAGHSQPRRPLGCLSGPWEGPHLRPAGAAVCGAAAGL